MNGLKTFDNSQDSAQEEGPASEKDETHRPAARVVGVGEVPPSKTLGVSEIVARLKEFEQSLGQQPIIDRERVKGVQRALINGAYNIDVERIAGKMLAFERMLGDET